MGWWNWFRKRGSLERVPDFVWLTRQAAFQGIRRSILTHAADGSLVVVIAHFPQTLAKVRAMLDEGPIRYREATGRLLLPENVLEAAREGGGCALVPGDALYTELEPAAGLDPAHAVAVVVAERHPIRSPDAGIERFAAAVPHPARLEYHISVEDALLRSFGGDWVGPVLRNLGMSETEPVQSRMVVKRIVQAQRKNEKTAFGSERAESAEEWFRWNMPGQTQATPERRPR
jgi:hypothetical protein